MSIHGVLGEHTTYPTVYDPAILHPIARSLARESLSLPAKALGNGADIWHGYELSWLNTMGIPQVAIVRLTIPADSPFIVESKSLKLYLNGFNFTCFDDNTGVIATIKQDISTCIKQTISVELLPLTNTALPIVELWGECIDSALDKQGYQTGKTGNCQISDGQTDNAINANLLRSLNSTITRQRYYSHLLRSNCPVTNQPDWGTVFIDIESGVLDKGALLAYLLGYRRHNGFHEQCVEQIFCDLMTAFTPTSLLVQAFYTRRGGLDINPYRMSEHYQDKVVASRLVRQ